MKTTNYFDTFISVADDCPLQAAEAPPTKPGARTVANIEYDMVSPRPYTYTSDDVLFAVYAEKNNIPEAARPAAREQFFSKGQPCFRSSPLTKRYGWGMHSNADGKMALFGLGSDEYRQLEADPSIEHLKAMRSKRA